jgi:hypothetical protein
VTEEMLECGICSNGPVKIYHVGGPCPHSPVHQFYRAAADALARKIDREMTRRPCDFVY